MAASYPTAAKTFTTKNAGDTIQPGHVNDLQDEVAAIEAGLLNGTAPLNSSNSTVANLVVTGGSTMGTLQVSSNCTIAGTLTVTTIISTSISGAGVTSYVRAYATDANLLQVSSAMAVVGFNAREADLSSEFDSTTYTFTPKSSGYYLITARCLHAAAALGAIDLGVYVNSSLQILSGDWQGSGFVNGYAVATGTLNLSSGASGAVQFKARVATSTGRLSTGIENTSVEILKVF